MTRRKPKVKEAQTLSEYKIILRVDAEGRLNEDQKYALRIRIQDFLETLEDIDEWPRMPELSLVSSKILFLDDVSPK